MEFTNGILLHENDIAPNRYAARTMTLIAGLLVVLEIVNDFGIIVVPRLNMHVSVLVALFACFSTRHMGFNERLSALPATKYIIMGIALATIFTVMLMLDHWASVALFFPFMLAAQYHSKKITAITIAVICFTALVTLPLGCLLGLWDRYYFTYQLKMMGFDTSGITAVENWDRWSCALDVGIYLGIPRLLIAAIFSTVLGSVTRAEQASLSQRVRETGLSRTDALTGVFSRHAYEEIMRQLDAGGAEGLICVYADVNGLHNLNNSDGHDAGDRLLVSCAEILREVFGNRVFRTGGDEFVVLSLEKFNTTERVARAEKLLAEKNLSMSIGSSTHETGENIHDTMRRAEQKMYAAKRAYYSRPGNDRRRRDRNGETE